MDNQGGGKRKSTSSGIENTYKVAASNRRTCSPSLSCLIMFKINSKLAVSSSQLNSTINLATWPHIFEVFFHLAFLTTMLTYNVASSSLFAASQLYSFIEYLGLQNYDLFILSFIIASQFEIFILLTAATQRWPWNWLSCIFVTTDINLSLIMWHQNHCLGWLLSFFWGFAT